MKFELFVKRQEHFFNLPVSNIQVRRFSQLIKQYCIAFHFRNLQPHLIGIKNYFQQFPDDVLTVFEFDAIHKLSKPADIGNKY